MVGEARTTCGCLSETVNRILIYGSHHIYHIIFNHIMSIAGNSTVE